MSVVVIFEVKPTAVGKAEYLELAGAIKAELLEAKGVISAERFESLTEQGKLLSMSVWEDMQSVDTWRNNVAHRFAQQRGFGELFESYTIRVAEVVREYGLNDRVSAPADSNALLCKTTRQ